MHVYLIYLQFHRLNIHKPFFLILMKKYVPKLIPKEHLVLPDYFKESIETTPKKAENTGDLLWNVLSLLSILAAITVFSYHVGFSLSFLLFAFFASSWGKNRLERLLKFRFVPTLKLCTLGIMSFILIGNGFQYRDRIKQAEEDKRIAALAEQKAEVEAKRREVQRLDSVRTYLSKADNLLEKGAYAKAIYFYNQSGRFVSTDETDTQHRLHEGLANSYVRTKQYKLALQHYDELSRTSSLNGEQLYQQALCYQQVGRKTEAIAGFRQASEAGHRQATKLYDKLNPLVRKLLYYQTVCCDGSYSPSNAKGRGACSHHGGVCNWNKPIYETYRKYDVNGL